MMSKARGAKQVEANKWRYLKGNTNKNNLCWLLKLCLRNCHHIMLISHPTTHETRTNHTIGSIGVLFTAGLFVWKFHTQWLSVRTESWRKELKKYDIFENKALLNVWQIYVYMICDDCNMCYAHATREYTCNSTTSRHDERKHAHTHSGFLLHSSPPVTNTTTRTNLGQRFEVVSRVRLANQLKGTFRLLFGLETASLCWVLRKTTHYISTSRPPAIRCQLDYGTL